MYVVQSDACNLPNGGMPPTAAAIAAAQAAVAQTETQISNAQSAFDSVVSRPDMAPAPTVAPLNVTFRGQAWRDYPAGTTPLPGSKAHARPPMGYCRPSQSVPSGSHLQTTPAPPMPSLTTSHGVDTPLAPPTTGNPCLDVQLGYALQSQLTPAMLWKCSQAGYFKTGLKPTVASVLALANRNQLPPLPDASVPPYDPSMVAGMGQADGGSPFVLWASIGLAGAVVWLAHEWGKAKGRH
jgi:hypothetical protein